jgi:signal transduction histidine kinase
VAEVEQQQVSARLEPLMVARLAAIAAVLIGVAVALGWWLKIPALQSAWPGDARMPLNGAVMFVLLGIALHSKIQPGAGRPGRRLYRIVGEAAALLVSIVAVLTLVEYVFGRKTGIDELILKDLLAAAHKAIAGRLAFPTALNALCLSLGLAALEVRIGRVWLSQLMAVLGLLVSVLALVGYACRVPEFYGQLSAHPGTAMSVHGMAGFLLLGVGLLCVRSERGLTAVLWSDTPGGVLARRLILAPAAGLLLTGVVYVTLTLALPVDHAIRTWVLGLANLVFVTVPIWAAAHALHLAGLERAQDHQALEGRVQERTQELTQTNAALHAEIRDHARAEAALREARDRLKSQAAELERRVTERTAKLAETVGDLESFSYSVAHDMRAPLRGMQGFARLLLDEHSVQLDQEGRTYLERIATAASRMDLLIQDALSYTQVLRHETQLELVDLDRVVRNLVQTFPGWQPPQAEVKVTGELPQAVGHEGLLAQCVSNLVANAVKFVPPGVSPQVRIWAESLDTHVRLWIEDNGIGIAEKDHTRIFRMFERLNRAEQYEGTGIGLAVVRKAVERMGGRVDFKSELGGGSQFWIELKKAPPP